MSERSIIEVNGNSYQVGKLPALTQLHVARRLMPCMAALAKVAPKAEEIPTEGDAENLMNEVIGSAGTALSKMPDEDVEYIIKTCLKVCYYKQPTGWVPMVNVQGHITNADLQLGDLLGVTLAVIRENLGGFFTSGPLPSGAAEVKPEAVSS